MQLQNQHETNPQSTNFIKILFTEEGAHRYFAIACLCWIVLCPLISFSIGHHGYGGSGGIATNTSSLLIGLGFVLPAAAVCTLFLYAAKQARVKDKDFLATVCYFCFLGTFFLLLFAGWFYFAIL